MDCRSCNRESDSYLKDNIPCELRIQVEDHLRTCSRCAEEYRILKLAEIVINQEKEVLSNPFLPTRIMAMIDKSDILRNRQKPFYLRALKPVLIAFTVSASVFTGILIGNIYEPADTIKKIPYELILINDATIESVNLFLEE